MNTKKTDGSSLKKIFSTNLLYYMKRAGLERNDICQRLNLPYMTVSDWCNGKSYPRTDKIEALAKILGVDEADLMVNNKPSDKFLEADDEVWEMRAALQQRPELKVLFDLSKNATKDGVEKAISIIETLMR